MSNLKRQHYVPQCYLREFVDHHTPPGQEPYIWIFNRGERKGRKKAPSNIFIENDLYTIKLKTGEKNYAIEETLSNLESRYAGIFRSKIKNHLPLNEEDHIILCAFVSVMLQRTLRHKDNLEQFYDELIKGVEEIERAHNVEPRKSQELRQQKEDIHKLGVVQLLPDVTELLMKMSIAFLVAEKGTRFVTSDDPCNLFNPDLQWQRFYGPGLAQKNVQVTLPLSPEIMLCMSWSNMRGYILWKKSRVQEANRMVVGHCYKYFISHSPKPKRMWFRRYPLDIFFMLKVLIRKIEMWRYKNKMLYKIKNVKRK
jgi:hypothetical protein